MTNCTQLAKFACQKVHTNEHLIPDPRMRWAVESSIHYLEGNMGRRGLVEAHAVANMVFEEELLRCPEGTDTRFLAIEAGQKAVAALFHAAVGEDEDVVRHCHKAEALIELAAIFHSRPVPVTEATL